LETQELQERIVGQTHNGGDLAANTCALVGSAIGDRYRLTAVIASGALSTVYQAVDQISQKPVAIKMLPAGQITNAQTLRLFESNARLTIQHPNFVSVLDRGLAADGSPWLAMEHLDGTDLDTLLKQEGYLTLESALPIIEQLLESIAYLHSQGEVHINLKPSSIMLVKTGAGKYLVKITDFGISKDLLENELSSLPVDELAGKSPFYMSPEQFKGARIDARSDVYSLGCIFYHMLIGRPPHEGINLLDTMDKHINTDLVFPAEPELPVPLYPVLAKMLQKQALDRQGDAAEVRVQLHSAISGQQAPPAPKPPSRDEATQRRSLVAGWKPTRKKKGKEPWNLLLLCITVLLVVVLVQQAISITRQSSLIRTLHKQ
jgi:eukaryotic-like serine/threonine-protein kinase